MHSPKYEEACKKLAKKLIKKKKVIIIVDDSVDKELSRLENLLMQDYEVLSFTDADEFYEHINCEGDITYDLAIVDLSFHDKSHDGIEIIDKLKTRYPYRNVVCCSSYASNKQITDEFSVYLKKPDGVFTKRTCSPSQQLDIINGFLKKAEVY